MIINSKMKLKIKKLQGGECYVEVQPTTTIAEIKKQVAVQLKIPAAEQKLLYMGRKLGDKHTVQSYPNLKDGSKLNLIVKKAEKPAGLQDALYKIYKKRGMSNAEAGAKAKKFMQTLEEKINLFSWDDIERLSADCMRPEYLPK